MSDGLLAQSIKQRQAKQTETFSVGRASPQPQVSRLVKYFCTFLLMAISCWTVAAQPAVSSTTNSPTATGLEMTYPLNLRISVQTESRARKNGVSAEVVKSRMQDRLRAEGFVLAGGPTEGQLDMSLDTDADGEHLAITLSFSRLVRFEAAGKTHIITAPVWSRDFEGNFNGQIAVIPIIAEKLLDDFIDEHTNANPYAKLEGKITASDPKFRFVVMNVGSQDGVQTNIEMVVSRAGKAVGIIKVGRVEKDHAFGNILHEAAEGGILEGDIVKPR